MKNIPLAQISTFKITGKDRNGKRFVINTGNYTHAMCINLWHGSVWAVMETGKKILLKRVCN